MKQMKTTHIGDTVRIRRPPKVFTDELGRTVWVSGVDSFELELEQEATTDPYNSVDGPDWRDRTIVPGAA